jgi:hypothetical protein
MSTDISKTIKELARMRPAQGYVLSVYVDAAPDGRGRRNFNVFLKKQFSEYEKGLRARSPESSGFPGDAQRVIRYLETELKPESKGAAVFVRQGQKDFQSFQTVLPLGNRVVIAKQPFIYPLARIADDYGRYGILISSGKQARLMLVHLGRVEAEAGIIPAPDDDTAKGYQPRKGRLGWNDERHQRHLDDLVSKHVKAAIREAQRFFPGDINFLLVAAEKGTLAEIQRQMPAGLKKLLETTAKFDIKSPDKRVLEISLSIFKELENRGSQKMAREAVVLAKSKVSRAVLGTKASLSALQDGRAEILIVSERFAGDGWQCNGCLKLGAAAKPRVCIYCGRREINRRPDMKEEMVSLALGYGVGIEFVENSPELDANGGIAVLLKRR